MPKCLLSKGGQRIMPLIINVMKEKYEDWDSNPGFRLEPLRHKENPLFQGFSDTIGLHRQSSQCTVSCTPQHIMASIYKRPGTKVWQCAFYVTDPETGKTKQVRKSTGKTNPGKAKNAAADIEREERAKAGAGSDKAQRILEVLERAGQEARKEILNAARARQFLAEIVKISTGEDMPAYTIRTWLEEWRRRKADVTAEATRMRYKASVKAFNDWLGERADKPLESLTV